MARRSEQSDIDAITNFKRAHEDQWLNCLPVPKEEREWFKREFDALPPCLQAIVVKPKINLTARDACDAVAVMQDDQHKKAAHLKLLDAMWSYENRIIDAEPTPWPRPADADHDICKKYGRELCTVRGRELWTLRNSIMQALKSRCLASEPQARKLLVDGFVVVRFRPAPRREEERDMIDDLGIVSQWYHISDVMLNPFEFWVQGCEVVTDEVEKACACPSITEIALRAFAKT